MEKTLEITVADINAAGETKAQGSDEHLVITKGDLPPDHETVWFGSSSNNDSKNGKMEQHADHQGFGVDDVKALKEELKIPDLFWPVTLVVDNSSSQASNIKKRVLHQIAGRLILALGMGMKQSEVPVVAFADRLRRLDPITAKHAAYYAGEKADVIDGKGGQDGKKSNILDIFRNVAPRHQGNMLDTLRPSGEFTYLHTVYSQLRKKGEPQILIVVTDGRFSDDWYIVKMNLDWMEAMDNPPMHITFIDVDEPENNMDPSQPSHMLSRIQKENYSFINVISGNEVMSMSPQDIAHGVLESLGSYAKLLQESPLVDEHRSKTDTTVLGQDFKWYGRFIPWTAPHVYPTHLPDYLPLKEPTTGSYKGPPISEKGSI